MHISKETGIASMRGRTPLEVARAGLSWCHEKANDRVGKIDHVLLM